MAIERGYQGVIELGGTPNNVAHLRSWSVEETGSRIDTSEMGTANASSIIGQYETTGTATMFYDHSDAGQLEIEMGVTVAMSLYPAGKGTGKPERSGNIEITRLGEAAEVAGMITRDFDFSAPSGLPTTTQS